MTPMAVLQVMAMNGDPRAAAALAAANNSSGQDMGNDMRSQNQSQNSFPQSQRGMMTNQSSLSGVDHRPMASFGSLPDETGQPNRLLMGENQSFGGKTGLNWGNSRNVGHQRQNEMEYNRNEIESKMIRRPNQLQQNMFRNTSEPGETCRPMAALGETNKFNLRQTTDHLVRTPEINQQQQFQASNFSLGRGSEMNTFGGGDSTQNFPSKSNEKSQTQAWSRPKFNPFANQEEAGSNQNMGDWSRGSGGRQGSGMTGNLPGQGSSFPSTSFGKTFPQNSSGPSGQFGRSFNRDAPAAQGRAFSNESPEVDRRHSVSASHTEQHHGGNFLQNTSRPFQGNNSEMSMPFKGIGSESNKSMPGRSTSLNRDFTGNASGVERSSFQPQRNFSGNSYNHSSVSGGNIPDPNRSYSQYSDNVSGPAPGNINRNNRFRSMQGQNRR